MIVQFDARLVEETVRRADGDAAYHEQRETIYALDPEQRDAAFAALHHRWFLRLGLDVPVREALGEQPLIATAVPQCVVAPAPRIRDQGAELYVRPRKQEALDHEHRRLRIALCPQTLLAPAVLWPLLRRELQHIADMVDPAFGYEPELPAAPGGPTHDRLLLDRYAALWSASVTGRLVCAARLPASERAVALRRFLASFPMFADKADAVFDRFFFCQRPTHRELVQFARQPRSSAGAWTGELGSRCSLCSMPTYLFEELEETVRDRVLTDEPGWRPDQAVCPQCAELYRARSATCGDCTIERGGGKLAPGPGDWA